MTSASASAPVTQWTRSRGGGGSGSPPPAPVVPLEAPEELDALAAVADAALELLVPDDAVEPPPRAGSSVHAHVAATTPRTKTRSAGEEGLTAERIRVRPRRRRIARVTWEAYARDAVATIDPPPRNVEELRARIESGHRPKYVLFWGHTPSRSGELGKECFSQWYPAPFVVDGISYATAEHFMMEAKARLFGDAEAAAAILGARTPAEAKRLGRGVRGFDEGTWVRERFDIVVRASVAKFEQNAPLRAHLLATNDRVLVEASPTDRVWGIGLAARDEGAEDPARWKGLNLLGFALMAARAALASRP